MEDSINLEELNTTEPAKDQLLRLIVDAQIGKNGNTAIPMLQNMSVQEIARLFQDKEGTVLSIVAETSDKALEFAEQLLRKIPGISEKQILVITSTQQLHKMGGGDDKFVVLLDNYDSTYPAYTWINLLINKGLTLVSSFSPAYLAYHVKIRSTKIIVAGNDPYQELKTLFTDFNTQPEGCLVKSI